MIHEFNDIGAGVWHHASTRRCSSLRERCKARSTLRLAPHDAARGDECEELERGGSDGDTRDNGGFVFGSIQENCLALLGIQLLITRLLIGLGAQCTSGQLAFRPADGKIRRTCDLE